MPSLQCMLFAFLVSIWLVGAIETYKLKVYEVLEVDNKPFLTKLSKIASVVLWPITWILIIGLLFWVISYISREFDEENW